MITYAQLVTCGLTSGAITHRVRGRRLHRVHRAVYLVGYRNLTREATWMAAVLACGDGAVLSHLPAAALWGMLKPEEGPIDITVPTHSGRERRDGIRTHRRAAAVRAALTLRSDREPIPAATVHDAIPVTAPWRTIDDLRSAAPDPRNPVTPKLYRRAVREAELRRFVLSPRTPRDRTRSEVEREFLLLCREQGFAAPEVNARIGRWTVDFFWREAALAVEIDTWGTHGGSVAFEDDHLRDLELRGFGLAVHRYTDLLLETAPELIAAELRERLGADPGRLI